MNSDRNQTSFITPYEGSEPYIFISYSHQDSDRVFPILRVLKENGFRFWYDEGIDPGSEWPESIAKHLGSCSVCLAFISKNSIESKNCRREINYALSKDLGFLSVVLEECCMSPGMELQLSTYQSLLKYKYLFDTFMEKLMDVDILSPCKEKKTYDSTDSDPEDLAKSSEDEKNRSEDAANSAKKEEKKETRTESDIQKTDTGIQKKSDRSGPESEVFRAKAPEKTEIPKRGTGNLYKILGIASAVLVIVIIAVVLSHQKSDSTGVITESKTAGTISSTSVSGSTAAASEKRTSDDENKTPETGGDGDLILVTGGEMGTYYSLGNVLAQLVSEKTDTSVTAIASYGSRGNIEDLETGGAQLGFTQSDLMSYAYEGTNLFEDYGAFGSFSVAAALYSEPIQIITLNSNIKSVADLAGKNVSIGAAGSGVYYNAIDVLGVYGLSESDINSQYMSFGESIDDLMNGKIDAAFVTASAPNTVVSDLASDIQIFLVSLDDEHAEALNKQFPYYSRCTIPAEAYDTLEDVSTVAVGNVVIARDDVAEGDVYNFVSSILENLDEVEAAHEKGAELSLEFAAGVKDVPYHLGAAKYYEEKGIIVPTK